MIDGEKGGEQLPLLDSNKLDSCLENWMDGRMDKSELDELKNEKMNEGMS